MAGIVQAALALVGLSPGATRGQEGRAWDFVFAGIDGQPLPLRLYQGQVMLIVNTASRCGFTPQYAALQILADKYRRHGLVVIGVPSNDFGGQEPGTAEEIQAFCATNYRIAFPLAEKTVVAGDAAHPFYRWAARELGGVARPRWNFHKYLIGRDGRLIDWFSSVTAPDSSRLVKAVEAALAE